MESFIQGSVFCFSEREDSRSVLEGFTITGGIGSISWDWLSGGGIQLVNASSPTIRNCIIAGNRAGIGGGIACEDGSSPTVVGCIIRENSNSGVDCWSSSDPTFIDCEITRNWSGGGSRSGGGVSATKSSPTLVRCRITGNAGPWGGGFECREGGSPVLTDCIIRGNASAGEGGGAYATWNLSLTLTNCTILGNVSAADGGGVFCDNADLTLTGCVIAGNKAPGAGAIGVNRSEPAISSCTIAGNSGGEGAIGCHEESAPALVECILRGNSSAAVCGDLTRCLADGDPLFLDEGLFDFDRETTVDLGDLWYVIPDYVVAEPDYRLREGSPAIDAGAAGGGPSKDIDGHDRPCGAGMDLGAYESCWAPAGAASFIRGDANGSGSVSISDSIAILGFLFIGNWDLRCQDAADADDSGSLDLSDGIYGLFFLFMGSGRPPEPFPACGPDPRSDPLTCEPSAACP